MYWLYILYSKNLDRYYIGISQNPDQRLSFHNHSPKGWTKRGRPWVEVFRHPFPNRSEAQRAERFIKRQKSRAFIQRVISGEITL